MATALTNEEKKQLSNERQKAVRNAWKKEQERVKNGQGTRDWSPEQQKELVSRGAVSGYEGHHMKSVSLYPEYAGDSNNIQFLSEKEHLDAHEGNYHNATNGYYDPKTKVMNEFKGAELKPVPVNDLNERYVAKHDTTISRDRKSCGSDETSYKEITNAERARAFRAIHTKSDTASSGRERTRTTKGTNKGPRRGR